MSANPEVDGIVALPVQDPVEVEAPPAPETPVVAAPAPAPRSRPAWLVPAAIAAVGLIVSGTLGYFFFATSQQRDKLAAALTTTKATLASTQSDLNDAKSQAATIKTRDDYVALFVADDGKVQMDYANVSSCDTYSSCRSAAQQLLDDMQQFQSDRKAANVPSSLSSTDSSLGDALSAGIAGDQELIAGMDNDDTTKIKDGYGKISAAMLNVAKAQTELGAEIK